VEFFLNLFCMLPTSALFTFKVDSSTLELALISSKKSDALWCDSNQTEQACDQSHNKESKVHGEQSENTTSIIEMCDIIQYPKKKDVSFMLHLDGEYRMKPQVYTNFCNISVEKWGRNEINEWAETLPPVAQKEIKRWLRNENYTFNGEKISEWDSSTWQVKVKSEIARVQIQTSWEEFKKKNPGNNEAKSSHGKDEDTIVNEYDQIHPIQGQSFILSASQYTFEQFCFFFFLSSNFSPLECQKCLLQIRSLIKMEWTQSEEETLSREWINLVNDVHEKNVGELTPSVKHLKSFLGAINARFSQGAQEDAYAAFCTLVGALEKNSSCLEYRTKDQSEEQSEHIAENMFAQICKRSEMASIFDGITLEE
ncbi:hypothetical protein RFI_34830, partial [Reticulomyxa filosa]